MAGGLFAQIAAGPSGRPSPAWDRTAPVFGHLRKARRTALIRSILRGTP